MSDESRILIRDARLIDLDGLVALWLKLAKHHQALHSELYENEAHSAATYRAWLRRQIESADSMLLVAEKDDRLVGYLLGRIGQRAPVYAIREVGMIHDLMVSQTVRRQGVAQALLTETKARFRRRGIFHLNVTYSPNNPEARGFWESQGFEPLLYEAYLSI